jgi:hypothetical protein
MPNLNWNCSGCGLEHFCSSKVNSEVRSLVSPLINPQEDFVVPYLFCDSRQGLLNEGCCINFGAERNLYCMVDPSELENQEDATNLIKVHEVRTVGDRVWVTLRDFQKNQFYEFPVSSSEICYKFISRFEVEKALRDQVFAMIGA